LNRIAGGGAGPALTLSSIPPVLLAAIKETLRLDTPFPTAFPRTITAGAESAIPDLPAPLPVGTIVSAHTYILSQSKALWGADAEIWKPERWLDAKTEAEKREMEKKFVPFSKGARDCVGKEIALLVVAKAVVAVLKAWDVKAVGRPKGKSLLEMLYEECVISFTDVAEE
jgi:benzoate 4-monooxygenase